MIKVFKRTLAVLMVFLFAAAPLVGCSFVRPIDTEDGAVSFTYILDENGYSDFKNAAEKNTPFQKLKEDFTSVSELTSGKTYYVVAYTVAKTSDKSVVKFDNNGSLSLSTSDSERPVSELIEPVDYGYLDIGKQSGSMMRADNGKDRAASYKVAPHTTISSAEFCVYVKFTAKEEFTLSVTYKVTSTVKKDRYGFASSVNAKAKCYFPIKADVADFNVSYLASENYVDGRYDAANLKSYKSIAVGESCYMVVSARLKNRTDLFDNTTVNFKMNISPLTVINARLDAADSGTFSESESDNGKNISVTFNVPTKEGEEKEFVFIVKLTPVSEGKVTASFDIEANGVSIVWGDILSTASLTVGEK